MSSTVMAVRAVTSQYAKDLLKPVLLVGTGVYLFVMAIVIWIALVVNGWWILLSFVPTVLFCVGLAIWLGVWFTARRLSPNMNKTQKGATKEVVEQVSRIADQLGRPRFVLIFRVVKDVLFPPPGKRTLIGELADTPGELHRSFEKLRKLF